MTHRHELSQHRNQLHEIRNIMHSMKTLAIMETHKLEHFIKTQAMMKETIKNIAEDFLQFHPHVLPDVEPAENIIVLIGTERGFCGDFNEQLITKLNQSFTDKEKQNSSLIVIGSKLHTLIEDSGSDVFLLEGASIVEEVFNVVNALTEKMANYRQPSSLYVISHKHEHNEIVTEQLLPPFKDLNNSVKTHAHAPLINLSPRDFFFDLTDHYLFNSIHRILYVSLMIENQYRTQHLENATHHLDEKTDNLKHQINRLRQEEIIEEIEVILLNTSSS